MCMSKWGSWAVRIQLKVGISNLCSTCPFCNILNYFVPINSRIICSTSNLTVILCDLLANYVTAYTTTSAFQCGECVVCVPTVLPIEIVPGTSVSQLRLGKLCCIIVKHNEILGVYIQLVVRDMHVKFAIVQLYYVSLAIINFYRKTK